MRVAGGDDAGAPNQTWLTERHAAFLGRGVGFFEEGNFHPDFILAAHR